MKMTATDLEEIFKNYQVHLEEISAQELEKNKSTVETFQEYARSKSLTLEFSDFSYIPTIGIVAEKEGLLKALAPEIPPDKEGLRAVLDLKREWEMKETVPGFFYSDQFMAMPHAFFRRSFFERNNYSPRLIELLWELSDPNIELDIALDEKRVRINIDDCRCLEEDTWFGAPFDEDIASIQDGPVKLRPPMDLDRQIINFLFSDTYSLDLFWESKGKIKTFQAEEFKSEAITIKTESRSFFPARYIHAEFDTSKNQFRHFDGAIHLYNEDDYLLRRDLDFNFFRKGNRHLKPESVKLFKMNGKISGERWAEYSSHFLTGDPLIVEYFTGEYPAHISEILESIRRHSNDEF